MTLIRCPAGQDRPAVKTADRFGSPPPSRSNQRKIAENCENLAALCQEFWIHTHLREQVRLVAGRQRDPSAAILDSQSVQSTENSQERGYDAGKQVNGRKRHILVDTLGLLLWVMVLPAHLQDRDGAQQWLGAFFQQSPPRRVQHLWADGGDTGGLLPWAKHVWRCTVEIVKRSARHTFKVLPRRWVVERTFGWFGRYRRLNRDHERQAHTGEIMVYLAMTRLRLARLGRS